MNQLAHILIDKQVNELLREYLEVSKQIEHTGVNGVIQLTTLKEQAQNLLSRCESTEKLCQSNIITLKKMAEGCRFCKTTRTSVTLPWIQRNTKARESKDKNSVSSLAQSVRTGSLSRKKVTQSTYQSHKRKVTQQKTDKLSTFKRLPTSSNKTPIKTKPEKPEKEATQVRVPEGAVLQIVMSQAEWRQIIRSRPKHMR